jgi:hypothetical protein
MNILQMLYDSEINFELSTFWDEGFRWKLGDRMNGFPAEGCADTFVEACEQLKEAAIRHFPESEFAQKIRAQA